MGKGVKVKASKVTKIKRVRKLKVKPVILAVAPSVASNAIISQLPANYDLYDKLKDTNFKFMHSPQFDSKLAEQRLFAVEVNLSGAKEIWASILAHNHTEFPFDSVSKKILLTTKEEVAVFLQYNFVKYKMSKILNTHRSQLTNVKLQLLSYWHSRYLELHEKVLLANLGLVIKVARRMGMLVDRESADLIQEGVMACMRAIEGFNVDRKFKFSTYAWSAIKKSIIRYLEVRKKKIGFMQAPESVSQVHSVQESHVLKTTDMGFEDLRRVMDSNSAGLSPIEIEIIKHRYTGGLTLQKIGDLVNLTKERVRQLQETALAKLRVAMEIGYDDPKPYTRDDYESEPITHNRKIVARPHLQNYDTRI